MLRPARIANLGTEAPAPAYAASNRYVLGGAVRLGVLQIALLCLAGVASAQPPRAPEDSSVASRPPRSNRLGAAPDSSRESFGNRVSRLISDQIFAHPRVVNGLSAEPADAPFRAYGGRIIRRIRVVRVGVFEYYDGVSARSTETTVGLVGEALHVDTHGATIQKYLLMHEGDVLDPYTLADTERLLRRTPFILDAKIEVIPVGAAPDSVDVLVITRDRWSLGFDPNLKTARRYDLTVEERNLVGLGHQLRFDFDVDLDLDQNVGYTGTYRTDNVYGTFVRGEYRYRDTHFEGSHRWSLARERLAPAIRYIGALEVELAEQRPPTASDSLQSFGRGDVWAGRAFPVGSAPRGSTPRAAITPAARMRRLDYHQRPRVTAFENRPFRDRTLWLGSLSLNRSRFRESRLIRGYGRIEDIPYGFLVTFTGGTEVDEFENRPYYAGHGRMATYSEGLGYAFASAALGGHRHNGEWEDTVLRAEASYFSPLGSLWGFRFRHFLSLEYTRGTARRTGDTLRLDRESGLFSLDPNDRRGDQRLVASMESVTFVPFQLWGFRFALFEFLSVGTVGADHGSFLNGRYTSSAGIGLRFHNERLIFNPFELRFAFLVNGADGTTLNRYRFGTTPAVGLSGLEPGPPAVVPFE